jgi:hypothetical protein
VYIKIHNSYKCVCWFLGLIAVIVIFICINHLDAS